MTSPEQKVQDRCESFKSIHEGKFNNVDEEIKKLPDELENNWNNREFKEFLEKFKGIIDRKKLERNGNFRGHDKINAILPLLPELGYSFDHNVHSEIFACYSELLADRLYTDESVRRRILVSSINRYVDNILCTEKEKMCPEIKRLLTFLSNNCEEQTFEVEEEMYLFFQKQNDLSVSRFFRPKYVLQQIALNFMGKLYIYPLTSNFPERPGVYFIYHVGKTQLYEGSQVSPSTRYPVYVGMSQKNIAERLGDHLRNIKKTSDKKQSTKSQQTEGMKPEPSDFMVRFMIVDIEHYVRCIESMLIEYFSPVWNSEAMAFSFGNANDSGNLWHKFHIDKDQKTIENVLRYLKI